MENKRNIENKINIAEILKKCPEGMELDCTMYKDCKFLDIDIDATLGSYLIRIITPCGIKYLDRYGCYTTDNKAKCVIFPKGKTTWEGFEPPIKFEDGEILVHTQNQRFIMSICHKRINESLLKTHCILWDRDEGLSVNQEICWYKDTIRLATEEEKQKLFDAIEENGYRWNSKTKTLDKPFEPKFKVGDRIRHKQSYISGVITKIDDNCYKIKYDSTAVSFVNIKYQDDWELISNKFDISTLVPFESKVLVRNHKTHFWKPAIFGGYINNCSDDYKYIVMGETLYKYLIPYEGNEHLSCTTNDCNDYYKTWEE